jgi:hypothetical protein
MSPLLKRLIIQSIATRLHDTNTDAIKTTTFIWNIFRCVEYLTKHKPKLFFKLCEVYPHTAWHLSYVTWVWIGDDLYMEHDIVYDMCSEWFPSASFMLFETLHCIPPPPSNPVMKHTHTEQRIVWGGGERGKQVSPRLISLRSLNC